MSFDVVSLFTNIPLTETIELAVDIITQNEPDLKIERDELTQLFEFATAQSHFLFEGNVFDQVSKTRSVYGVTSSSSSRQSLHGIP